MADLAGSCRYLGYLFEERNLPKEISFWGSGVPGGQTWSDVPAKSVRHRNA
jgi:hypothetical protein